MHHDDYSIQYDDWLAYEGEIIRKGLRSKPFIGDRSYRHFDSRVSLAMLESNRAQIIPFLKSPKKLRHYSFFPFVRRDKKVRRFTKELNAKTNKKEVKIKQKNRPIMYASHLDACVYGFYAYMIKRIYDAKVHELGLQDSIIAYRKIPREDTSGRNKSNIDFANDIYKALGAQESTAVLAIDIEDFFGSMDHQLIKKKWKLLLNVSELPAGHQVVYRNITAYRYIFLYEAMEALGLGKLTKGKFYYSEKAKREGSITSPKRFNKVLNNDMYIHKNRSPKGIPQGSPISDTIANFYLLGFDIAMTDYLRQFNHALYKRYSDDILVVCPQEKAKEVYAYMHKLLSKESLMINEKKTELFFIDRKNRTLADSTRLLVPSYWKNKKTIQYLGFEFDLSDIHIRSGTIANHYRKLVSKMNPKTYEKESISKKPKKHSKKRDRYSYIKLASKRINSKRLHSQHRNIRKRTAKLRKQNKA